MFIIFLIITIVSIGFLILVHEFGHYLVAKLSGIKVETFSIGFGPSILQFEKGETLYKIGLVPLGGYVKLSGLNPSEKRGESYEFRSKPYYVRFLTVLAGPLFNVLASIFVLIILYSFVGVSTFSGRQVKSSKTGKLKYGDEIIEVDGKKVEDWYDVEFYLHDDESSFVKVIRDSDTIGLFLYRDKGDYDISPLIPVVIGRVFGEPALKAGLKSGAKILKVGDKEIKDYMDFRDIIIKNPGETLTVIFEKGRICTTQLVVGRKKILEDNTEKEIGFIGISVAVSKKKFGLMGIKKSVEVTFSTIVLTLKVLYKLLKGDISRKALGGPISVFHTVFESAKIGIDYLLTIIAFISIQLFILNLLPIPPLDGGYLFIFLFEKIRRKEVTEKGMQIVQLIGLSLLIMLVLFATMNDIARFMGRVK